MATVGGMAGRARPSLGLASLAALVACVEPESGIGYGSTGEASETLSSSAAPQDSGLDDTGDVPPFAPPEEHSYFIAESTDFTGNGCENDDVNDVTSSLRDALADDGWVGTRVVEGGTTPADFIDPAKRAFGLDPEAGDSAMLSVYAGHGWMNVLQWGTRDTTPGVPSGSQCRATIRDDVRLGAMAGGWARAVILLTSCTGRVDCYRETLATNDVTQAFAFNNSPMIWNNAPRRFYRKSARMANRHAWIRTMEDRPGFVKNSPVIYTRSTSFEDVLAIHQSARLSEIEDIPSANQTKWYAYTWIDHGLRGSCKPLPPVCTGDEE